MTEQVLLGNEVVAIAALQAGIAAAYSYPGTPASEITQYIISHAKEYGNPAASWTANEKSAYEAALGVSLAGGRALVSMKHVGLNVAADPFINSALTNIRGGLVLAVADDPGMHSSQNEQDSRFFADFARIICLEPSNQQEAYNMTRSAFGLSEDFHIPVMIRMVTRVSHGRSTVALDEDDGCAPLVKRGYSREDWVLLPSISRKLWKNLTALQSRLLDKSETSDFNTLLLNEKNTQLGILTTGIARHYYAENLTALPEPPSHLHIGMYPCPAGKIRALANHVEKILVLEEGYPFIEKYLRGIIPPQIRIAGRMDGTIPQTGELSPDIVRNALELPSNTGVAITTAEIPLRPPQFCYGCPHEDSFAVLKKAVEEFDEPLITSDIGCYTLSALPPYSLIHSTVCMGASIGMARGASHTGKHPVIAVIGDSTFYHSGTAGLMDAVNDNANITIIILDNEVVAMTGTQPAIFPSAKLQKLILGLGVAEEHCHVLRAEKSLEKQNSELLKKEIAYTGLSVVIMHRECVVSAKRRMKKQ